MCLSFLLHLVDFVLAQSARTGDGDFLLLARTEVLGRDVEDAVGIDVEGHFDLRDAARGGRDAVKMKGAELLIVLGHGALALQHFDFHARLVVGVGGKHVRLLGRDGGVARDHRRGDAAGRLDGKGQRGDVEQEHVLHVTLEHAALDRCAYGHNFVRVDPAVRVASDEILGCLDDLGHAGHAADQDEFIHFVFAELGILQASLDWLDRSREEVVGQLLEFRSGELFLDVLRTTRVGGDEGQVDLVFLGGGEGDLGFFRLLFDPLHGVGLFGKVDAGVRFELRHDPVHDLVVPVVAAEVRVAVGRLDFKDAVADFEGRNVEGAAAEVIDRDFFVLLFVEAVGEGGCSRLVDDAQDFEAGNLAGVLRRVALRVVEIGWDGDDRLGDFFTELGFRVGFEFGQDHRADFRRAERLLLAVDVEFDVGIAVGRLDQFVGDAFVLIFEFVELAPHEALDREDGVGRVGHGLALGGLADEAFAVLGESDDGRRGARALTVFQHNGFSAFHHGHAGVGCAEVDTEDFAHKV